MQGFVLDCSVTMAWCFDDEANVYSDRILAQLKETKAIVPLIWSLEIMNVLSVGERKKRISHSQANTFMNLLSTLPIELDIDNSELLNKTILDISREYAISVYDASYLEVAQRKKIPLASFDKILCTAALKAGIKMME